MKLHYLIGAVFVFFSSCQKHNFKLQAGFENIFDSKFTNSDPGGIVIVKKGDETIFLKSYGTANLKTKEKINENTIFNTGSISKTFVANGILMLEEAQLLSLEDSLYKYFKDFDNVKIAQKVKIKHLLSHNSGLPDSRQVSEMSEFYLTAKDQENFAPIKKTGVLNFEPGAQFEYSNPAYNGLALIIEKVSNQKWQKFIEENIFAVAGMKESKITDGSYPGEGVAHAYTPENGIFMEDDFGEYPTFAAAGNGGVWCSILDLVKYENAIRTFKFLSREAIEKSRRVNTPENWYGTLAPDVGYSWFILEKEIKPNEFGVKIISHTGWQGGFRAFFISIPEKDILYIGLFNRPINDLSESYNPFNYPGENSSDVRVAGIELLKKYNWLD